MGQATVTAGIRDLPLVARDRDGGLAWYAAYTCAHHEKRVAEQLSGRSVEHFLPLYESVRRWKDRRVQLKQPLFPGYVFVRIDVRERLRVLEIPSVARLVGFGGIPAPLPQGEIEALKAGLENGVQALPHTYVKVGRRVRITSGPLAGFTGILLRRQGKSRVAISVDLIQRSIVVDASEAEVEALPTTHTENQFD